jgi:hypothetical protein
MEQIEVILGVDTHLEVHVGAVISETGKLLGTRSASVDSGGYLDLLIWAKSFGDLRSAGVEGTGTYPPDCPAGAARGDEANVHDDTQGVGGSIAIPYGSATVGERFRILDEFVPLTGYHRKHAIRLPREEPRAAKGTRERNRLYDEAVRRPLTVLWEAADRLCGKRLKALIPKLVDAMERHGHLDLDAVVKAKLLQVSAATIDHTLANARAHIDGQRKRRTGMGWAIRRSIPVRIFADWRDLPPGFFEIDMVEHCGGSKIDGEFVHTLTLSNAISS